MISDEIIKVINELCNKFGIAIDWTSQNVTPYLNDLMSRYIKYDIATCVLAIILGVLFILIAIFSFKEWKKEEYKLYGERSEGKSIFCFVLSIILGIIAILVLLSAPERIVQDIFIPEKTVYEYIQSQIK